MGGGRIEPPDFFMQDAEKVAKRIVGALRRPCAEVWPMRTARLIAALATALPGPTAWALRKGYEKELAKSKLQPKSPPTPVKPAVASGGEKGG